MSIELVKWLSAEDLDPPHGLDMSSKHDADKVEMLERKFKSEGFDKRYPALIGYPLGGRIQLLSGTHRHAAATRTGVKLPVVLWLRSDIEKNWGNLTKWERIIQDIPVSELELWTRERLEAESIEQCSSIPGEYFNLLHPMENQYGT